MFTNAERLYYEISKYGLTQPYTVDIDRTLLEKVVMELDNKCVRTDFVTVEINAASKEEVITNLNNYEGVLINEIGTTLNLKKYSCIIPIKKYTKLAKIIQVILDIDTVVNVISVFRSRELKEQSTKIIEKFLNYSPTKDEEAGSDYLTIKALYDEAYKGIKLKSYRIGGISHLSDEPAEQLKSKLAKCLSEENLLIEIDKKMKF